ncbi:MAG: tetratricopeptide repeat protein [Acidobacteriia bacterium]|nr:tetratricopeptide repeat protein [Terriglobia bacterium]
MKIFLQTLVLIGCLLAAASAAQKPAPAPAPAPSPAPKGMALPDDAIYSSDAMERAQELASRLQDEKMAAQDKMMGDAQRRYEELAQITSSGGYGSGAGYGRLPFTLGNSADAAYERGQSALDRRRWDEALTYFNQAASKGGNRADGALYWKAYTLNKLGRREDAVAALAELRKSYPSSRWLDDAKALELEVKQASGQPVSPESQSDEELKLMALNGLMQSDPDRAIPALEALLKSAQSPRLKERALFVLAQSDSPKAQQLLEQVARGNFGNPDLQVKSINYMGAAWRGKARRTGAPSNQELSRSMLNSIYGSSNDVNVKRAILSYMSQQGDNEGLLQIAKTEKSSELRADAVRRLRSGSTGDALAGLYAGEQDKEVKRTILGALQLSCLWPPSPNCW